MGFFDWLRGKTPEQKKEEEMYRMKALYEGHAEEEKKPEESQEIIDTRLIPRMGGSRRIKKHRKTAKKSRKSKKERQSNKSRRSHR